MLSRPDLKPQQPMVDSSTYSVPRKRNPARYELRHDIIKERYAAARSHRRNRPTGRIRRDAMVRQATQRCPTKVYAELDSCLPPSSTRLPLSRLPADLLRRFPFLAAGRSAWTDRRSASIRFTTVAGGAVGASFLGGKLTSQAFWRMVRTQAPD